MEKKKPEIRFNGFEGEWVRHSLNYYLTVSSEKNQEGQYSKYDIYSVSREYGVINQIEYQGKSFAGASLLNYGVVQTEDIVYTKSPLKSQPYGIIKVNSGKSGLVSALYGVFHPQEPVCSYFIQVYFDLDHRLNSYLRPLVNKGAKNTLLISDADALQGEVIFPSRDEQEKLVSFFTTLDKLIAKLEAKLDKLRKLKQALLEKMFVNVNGGGYETPEIRFKGYTDKWKVKELGEVAMRVVSKNEDNRVTLPLTISAQYGLISQTDFFNNRIAAKDVRKYYVIKKGEFAYNRSTSEGSPFGAVKRLDRYNAGVLSTLYLVFRISSEEIDSNYLVCYFSTDSWHKHIEENAAEGARNHGLLNITSEDFFTTPIKVPMKKEEQSKVALSIRTLEEALIKESTKLTKLRNIKQSLLQKMFA